MSKLMILIVSTINLLSCSSMTPLGCSDNWKITGYYTPVESDFKGRSKNIQIMDADSYSFKEDFLAEVKIEGWGKTIDGWYLGYYGNNWHQSEFPKDARGHELYLGKVAADVNYLAPGNRIHIDNMSKILGQSQFKVADVGSAIKGRHIDVYVGEGESAKKKTWAITGTHRICSI